MFVLEDCMACRFVKEILSMSLTNLSKGMYHTRAQIRFKIPAKQMHLFDRKTGKNLLVK